MKILSIDFDYFVGVTAQVRNSQFPTAEDVTDPEEIKKLWGEVVSQYPRLLNSVSVTDDYFLLHTFLKRTKRHRKAIKVAESHKEIYDFIKEQQRQSSTPLEIVNIDFHHDNYYMYGGKVTCANWLMKIGEEENLTKDNVLWVRREDSETESLAGEFPYAMTTNIEDCLRDDYDAIFLCYSPEWTPPSLRVFFDRLVYWL